MAKSYIGRGSHKVYMADAFWTDYNSERADIWLNEGRDCLLVSTPDKSGALLGVPVAELLPILKDMGLIEGPGLRERVEEAVEKMRQKSYEMSMVGGEAGFDSKSFSSGHYVGWQKGIDQAHGWLAEALEATPDLELPTEPGAGVKVRDYDGNLEEFRLYSDGKWASGKYLSRTPEELLADFDLVEVLG